ncbi:MAG: ABC transporter permease [Bacillota bacterium]|nr:ABC transporter permease [Bacillota bacterium]
MITRYTQLTGRYLKASRKRTILTIIGIILSVALISSIGLFMKGIQDTAVQNTKKNYGSYHLMFKDADANLLAKISANPKVGRFGYFSSGKEIKIDDELSMREMSATDSALGLLPYKLKEGRLPQNGGEVAVEQWMLNKAFKNSKIGDTLTFDSKNYILTGILDNSVGGQVEGKGILLTKNDSDIPDRGSLLVEISSKTNLRAAVNELEKLVPKGDVIENDHLLVEEGAAAEGSPYRSLYAVVGIVIFIVLVSTIAVIYNSFQIGVVERIKQFGLLRAVGTTPRQIRNIVLREASLLAVIGVPLGVLFGVLAILCIGGVFKLIGGSSVLSLDLGISPSILAGSGLLGIVSIYLSALFPAIFAGRISPLVAISRRTAISKEKIKKRKNKVLQRLLGFEASMALKNIKRTRKRYRITVFSIIISVTLFITFKAFIDMALHLNPPPNESQNINFTVYFSDNDSADDNTYNALKNLQEVKNIYKSYSFQSFSAVVDRSSEVEAVKNIGGIYNETEKDGTPKTLINSSVEVYDDAALDKAKKYLTEGDIDSAKLDAENGVILVDNNTIYNGKTKKKYVGPAANLKVGDEIEVQFTGDPSNPSAAGNGEKKKVKILALLKDDPFMDTGNESGLKLITTKRMAESLSGVQDIKPRAYAIEIKDINNETEAQTAIEQVVAGKAGASLINNIDANRTSKSAGLMVYILLYGFVIVVSLIGSVNIINTITTNILLRKTEFAALKSIGLTQKGLRRMIVYEGLLYSFFGTVYGSVIATVLSYLMYMGLGGIREFAWGIPWLSIAIAGGAALMIGYLSVLSPLSRIKKDNIIDSIREDY